LLDLRGHGAGVEERRPGEQPAPFLTVQALAPQGPVADLIEHQFQIWTTL
jgi:hypothetical protein